MAATEGFADTDCLAFGDFAVGGLSNMDSMNTIQLAASSDKMDCSSG